MQSTDNQHEWVVHQLVVAKYPKGNHRKEGETLCTQLLPKDPPLTPSLMFVLTGDHLGMFFGYYSLLVYEIQAIYITLFLRNRDMLTFYCCFTHLLSEIMNYVLKHILKEPRPEHGAPGGGLFEGKYGMPSQHCHCFAFLVTMVLLLVFHYYAKQVGTMFKWLTLATGSLGLSLQVYGRLYLRYHTMAQCLGGVAFGSASAILFYILGNLLFMPYAEDLCRLSILRKFSFRKDLLSQPPSAQPKNCKPKKL